MPSVPTVFFVSIYGLVALAGLMLAFAEGNPFPQILTPALAIVAYVLTDRRGSRPSASAVGQHVGRRCLPARRLPDVPSRRSSYGCSSPLTWSSISPGSCSSRKRSAAILVDVPRCPCCRWPSARF